MGGTNENVYDLSLIIAQEELQNYVIHLIITRSELSKQLDNTRFIYEIKIGNIAVECFHLFSEVLRLDSIVYERERQNYFFNKEYGQDITKMNLYRQIHQKYETILVNHDEFMNNYVCYDLNEVELKELNELFHFFCVWTNPDTNPNLTSNKLTIWHEAEEYFAENNIHGLRKLKNEFNKLNNSNINQSILHGVEQEEYYEHLRKLTSELKDEIDVMSDPSFHPFWLDLLNEEDTISAIQKQIVLFQTMITDLTKQISKFTELNPRLV